MKVNSKQKASGSGCDNTFQNPQMSFSNNIVGNIILFMLLCNSPLSLCGYNQFLYVEWNR